MLPTHKPYTIPGISHSHNVCILILHTLYQGGVGLPNRAPVLLFNASIWSAWLSSRLSGALFCLVCVTLCLDVPWCALLCLAVSCCTWCALLCRVALFAKGGRAVHGRDLQAGTYRNLRPRRHAVLVRHRHLAAGVLISLLKLLKLLKQLQWAFLDRSGEYSMFTSIC